MQAGFDICEGKEFWYGVKKTQIEELAKGFLSTHPDGDERMENIDLFTVKARGKSCWKDTISEYFYNPNPDE